MKKVLAGIVGALIGVIGCGESSAPPPSPAPSPAPPAPAPAKGPREQFRVHMKANDKAFKGVLDDLRQGRPVDSIRERLAAIRANTEAARKLGHLKRAEGDENDPEQLFAVLLDRVAKMENAAWDGETGKKNAESLEFRCTTCHALYRD